MDSTSTSMSRSPGFSVPSTLRCTSSARSVGRRCGLTMPRCSRSRSSRSDSNRSSFRAFAAIRPTRSSASSCGRFSSVCSSVSAEPEDRGQRRPEVVRDRLQERVLHLVERAEPLCRFAFAPERLRVLPLAPTERLLGALALGDVDHQAAELSRPLRAAHHVHHVADPDRAAVGRGHPVLEVLVLARVRGDPRAGDRPVAILGDRVVAPTASLAIHSCSCRAQELLGAPADERKPERRRVRLPEDRVEARHELMEPLQLRETPCVAQRERRDVGDPAGQPKVLVGERRADVLRRPSRSRRSRRAPSAAERPGRRGLAEQPELLGTWSDDLRGIDERLGLAREERRGDVCRDAAIPLGGDRAPAGGARTAARWKSPVSSSRR